MTQAEFEKAAEDFVDELGDVINSGFVHIADRDNLLRLLKKLFERSTTIDAG